MMKKRLVYLLFYSGNLLAVCSTKAKARALAKKHIIDLDYAVDKFFIDEQPLF